MKLVIASDHGAIELRQALVTYLQSQYTDIDVVDLGIDTPESVDYPDFADRVATQVLSGNATMGILCCGTGIGIGIRANRYPGIRAALVYDAFTAEMAKAHNNANVLCLGGRTTDIEMAKQFVSVWLDTAFEGGRHQRRLDKLDAPLVSL